MARNQMPPPPMGPPMVGAAAQATSHTNPLHDAVDAKTARREHARAAKAAKPPTPPAPAASIALDESFFKALGYNRDAYYFLDSRSGQVKSFRARELRDLGNLLSLAPIDYWQGEFAKGKGDIDKDAVANVLIGVCYKRGFFSTDILRGRGAWWDNDRCVLHVGSHLIVESKRESITSFDSKYIYERGPSFDLKPAEPLGATGCHQFVDLCGRLPWERSYMGNILAGWVVCASVCGAMAWRPHIFVAGEAGSGKSIVQEDIVAKALGSIPLTVSSKTTEPGIRGKLGTDARPVVFEEAEGERMEDRQRLQHIYDVARLASSENSPPILKGSRNGGNGNQVDSYMMRSCFCMFGIVPTFTSQADQSRFFVLELIKIRSLSTAQRKLQQTRFEQLVADMSVVMTDEFPSRLIGRAIKNIDVLRHNAKMFSRTASIRFGDARFGDQLGALLAGRALLDHANRLNPEQAAHEMTKYGFPEGITFANETVEDQIELLNTLRQFEVEFLVGNNSRYRRIIGDLLECGAGFIKDDNLDEGHIQKELLKHGIKIVRDDFDPLKSMIWFSNTHSGIKKILKNTKWEANWGRSMRRLPGAIASLNVMRFGGGGQTKAVGVPAVILRPDLAPVPVVEPAPEPPSDDNPL